MKLIIMIVMLFSVQVYANPFSSFGKFVMKKFSQEGVELTVKQSAKKVLQSMSEDEQDTFYIIASAFFVKKHSLTLDELQGRTSIPAFQIKMFAMRNAALFKTSSDFANFHVKLTTLGMRVYRSIEKTLSSETITIINDLEAAGAQKGRWVKLSDIYGDSEGYKQEIYSFVHQNGDLAEIMVDDDGVEIIRLLED
jgi:hypothetical protein